MRQPAAYGVLACFVAAACGQPPPARVERTVVLMGTPATFVAEATDRETALARVERMVRVVEDAEAELSTWREDSALSALNRQPLWKPLAVVSPVCELLGRLEVWRRATAGAFEPAVGSLVEAWRLRDAGSQPTAEELRAATLRAAWPLLGFNREACTVTRQADVALDAGGFGKGEALDRVRAAERGHPGAWLIDFGGQVAVSGGDANSVWPVALANPARRDQPVAEVLLSAGSLATSGGSERTLTLADGNRLGHILDPRSGLPLVRPASVTVWHQDAFAADVLSTALYVMGPDAGLAWAAARDFAACFIVPLTGSDAVDLRATPAFERRLPLRLLPH